MNTLTSDEKMLDDLLRKLLEQQRDMSARLYMYILLGKPVKPLLEVFEKMLGGKAAIEAENSRRIEAARLQGMLEDDERFALATVIRVKEVYGDGSIEYQIAKDNAVKFVANQGGAS